MDNSLSVTDAEFQHEIGLSHHRFVLGAGYRLARDSNIASPWIRLEPPRRTTHRSSIFVQDEIALTPGKLLLTLGSKLERNTFTGWEIQPSASLLWNRTADDAFWLSASRAVRIPSRGERDVFYDAFSFPGPDGSIIVTQNQPTTEFVAERLQAYEAGYRRSITPRLSLDVAGFYNPSVTATSGKASPMCAALLRSRSSCPYSCGIPTISVIMAPK